MSDDRRPILDPNNWPAWQAFVEGMVCPFCGDDGIKMKLINRRRWKAILADCDKCGGCAQWAYYDVGSGDRK